MTKKATYKKLIILIIKQQITLFAFWSSHALADSTTIAVASNFSKTFMRLSTEFSAQSQHKIKPAFGSTAVLAMQAHNGAPYDGFLSADQGTVEAFIHKGLAQPKTRFTYATGQLVLWSTSHQDASSIENALKNLNFSKLALANPKLAPYGRAAEEVLIHLKLEEKSRPQWVIGISVAQAHQFTQSGNADLGFVALAQVIENGIIANGGAWVIPKNFYSPIRQDAIILNSGKNNVATKAFFEFLRSPRAKKIITQDGYLEESNKLKQTLNDRVIHRNPQ